MDVLNRPIPILATPCGAYSAHPSVATLPTIATCYLCNIHSHVLLQLAHLNPVLPHSSLVATHNPCEIYLVLGEHIRLPLRIDLAQSVAPIPVPDSLGPDVGEYLSREKDIYLSRPIPDLPWPPLWNPPL